ncbi:MAG: DUF480 domain-containing protein [Phycisphaera sp.]|nr:DUF480 domain-containing protein [Phycisphaera sp.]
MPTLAPDECRVLGTLIEKALTTPAQYPLSLNSLVTGVSQKSNRDPVVEFDDDRALTALDGLRSKGLVRDVSFTGSRVEKFRHTAGEALGLRAPELALLCELLLRGPQTVGELRARAARMQPFESIEAVEGALGGLAGREAPLVRELAPLPGSRAPRWQQLLCDDLHPLGAAATQGVRAGDGGAPERASDRDGRLAALEARVARLEEEVAFLRGTGAQPTP